MSKDLLQFMKKQDGISKKIQPPLKKAEEKVKSDHQKKKEKNIPNNKATSIVNDIPSPTIPTPIVTPSSFSNKFTELNERLAKLKEERKGSPEYVRLHELIIPLQYFISLIENYEDLAVIDEKYIALCYNLEDIKYILDVVMGRITPKPLT